MHDSGRILSPANIALLTLVASAVQPDLSNREQVKGLTFWVRVRVSIIPTLDVGQIPFGCQRPRQHGGGKAQIRSRSSRPAFGSNLLWCQNLNRLKTL